MEIINNTLFEATFLAGAGPNEAGDESPFRDYIVIIVKGTFDLIHEQACSPASKQVPIFESDQFYGEPGLSSVKAESDYVLFKPKTDVVLLGNAYAPGGSAEQCDASLKVGSYEKTIRVFGERQWELIPGLPLSKPSSPENFETIELKYENALGGQGFPQNLAGKGHYEDLADAVAQALPNLENPQDLIETNATLDSIEPQCLNWYGRAWAPRLAKAGNIEHSAPELPDDFNWEFNNGASPDLILPFLNGDEEIVLTNCELTGSFRFRLPGITPNVAVDFGFRVKPVSMVLDTVCIMMETSLDVGDEEVPVKQQASLVWRGGIAIDETQRLDAIKTIIID